MPKALTTVAKSGSAWLTWKKLDSFRISCVTPISCPDSIWQCSKVRATPCLSTEVTRTPNLASRASTRCESPLRLDEDEAGIWMTLVAESVRLSSTVSSEVVELLIFLQVCLCVFKKHSSKKVILQS